MTVNEILDLAREQTDENSVDLDNTKLINYLNTVYRDVCSRLTIDNDNFFIEDDTQNIVSWTNAYAIPSTAEKVIAVYVKYDSDDTYQLRQRSDSVINDTYHSIEYLENETPTNAAFYEIVEDNVVIYPSPSENVTNGITVRYTEIPADLVVWWAESTIRFKPKYHDILWLGIKQYIYQYRQKLNEKNDAKAEYERELAKMITYIGTRDYSPTYDYLPPNMEIRE